ncbi:MAG: hypothetical protein IPM39_06445 [Chloroflexi bacterium]|nr:hypothetical protein [Chloroflexota bacterium]
MMKNEERLAQELDDFLTAQLEGRPFTPAADVQEEARLAGALLELAANQSLEPAFFTNLEARLNAAASPTRLDKPTVRPPSVWQQVIETIKEGFTMKRMTLAIGALATLLIIGYFAWSAWQSSVVPGLGAIADTGATAVAPTEAVIEVYPTDESLVNDLLFRPATEVVRITPPATAVSQPTADPASALPLPGLGSASGISMGMGGGGDASLTGDLSGEAMPVDIIPAPWNPLSGTTYIMNAGFPTEPVAQPVYSQPGQNMLTQADARRYADLFGLAGPIFTDVPWPDMPADYVMSPVYFVFDGPRTLAVRTDGLYYFDQSAAPDYFAQAGSYEQSAPIAEAFLLERGLLDFPYEMRPTAGGSDVEFRRLVDGRPVMLAEFFVSVNDEGQVISVSYQPLTQLSNIGLYPLRTAEDAWRQVLADGIDYQSATFITYPGPNWTPPVPEPYVDPYADLYKSWQRQYNDGDAITIYPYPTVHVAVDGQAPPRIQVDQYLLLGSDADLRAIAEYAYQQIRVSGTVRQSATQKAIELAAWEPVDQDAFQYLPGLPGTIQRVGDGVQFNADGGEVFVLEQPPTDIADGERVYLYGWRTTMADGQTGFSWQNMDRIIEYEPVIEEPMVEPLPFEPYRINEATIDSIDLVYIFTPIFAEDFQLSQFVVQPAWRFRGFTDANEVIEIFVQAVPPQFVQSP